MMAAERRSRELIDRLPAVRGAYRPRADLSRYTWFRVGGPAEVLFQPADRDDLAVFLAGKPGDVPVTVISVGSNVLIRDGGVPGVVVRLGRPFGEIAVDGTGIEAGAAALDVRVAAAARDAGIAGLEFLCGIPGAIGGALRMNAGAYGREMKDVVVSVEALDGTGTVRRLANAEVGFAYRRTGVPDDWIFVAARLQGERGERSAIAERMDAIRAEREDSQPLRTRTGGSTFRNPGPDEGDGRRAWELIDAAGCRGLCRGGAMVSDKHCNFLINTGNATAADIEGLGEEVRRRVKEATGVSLQWEIRRIGEPGRGTLEEVTS